MTAEEAREYLENCESTYDQTDRIYEGLTILKKYHEDAKFSYNFGHEEFWVGAVDFNLYIEVMSDDDIKRMGELGWMEDEDAWRHSDFAG